MFPLADLPPQVHCARVQRSILAIPHPPPMRIALGMVFIRIIKWICLMEPFTRKGRSSVQSFNHVRLFVNHWLQDTRFPFLLPTPGAYSNSCPLSQCCHPTISSSVVPFYSCLQSFPAPGSFEMSQFFASGGQSINLPASASVLPMNIQEWFALGWTSLISLQSKWLSRVFSDTTFKIISFSVLIFLNSPTLTSVHDYWKNHSFD